MFLNCGFVVGFGGIFVRDEIKVVFWFGGLVFFVIIVVVWVVRIFDVGLSGGCSLVVFREVMGVGVIFYLIFWFLNVIGF